MYRIGWKIVCSNKKRYLTVILLFSAILTLFLTQLSVLLHRMYQSSSVIGKMPHIAIWVMHPHAQVIDDHFQVGMDVQGTLQSIDGVQVASPLIIGNVTASLAKGKAVRCHVVGSVPQGLGGPRYVTEGHPHSLEHARTAFVDRQSLSQLYPQRLGRKVRGKLGAHLKVNDRILRVVGIFDRKNRAATQPLLHTNLAQARELLNVSDDCTLYYGVKVTKDADVGRICQQIMRQTGLKAVAHSEFISSNIKHHLQQEHTLRYYWALLISGVALFFVLLMFMVRHFTLLLAEQLLSFRAMGASPWNLLQMTGVQSVIITGGSWLLGIFWYLLFAFATGITPAFSLITNELYFGALVVIGLITILSSSISIGNFLRNEEDLLYRL